jgi:hypothetical protein
MTKRTLTVRTYEDFLENIPTSGLFEMTDCAVEIWCPEFAQADEIQKMVILLESMVHLTDVKIGSDVENLLSDDYRIVLIEDSVTLGRTKNPRGKK